MPFASTLGVTPGEAKGTSSAPYVMPAPQSVSGGGVAAVKKGGLSATRAMNFTYTWGSCNNCAELNPQTVMHTWEPGQGTYNGWDFPNYGAGTPYTDDNGATYNDSNMVNLCGPDAADVALEYWPLPPNGLSTTATDPYTGRNVGYWKGTDPYDDTYRMRGYMVQLAWNIHAPSYIIPGTTTPFNGMMRNGHGSVDWVVRDGMNWEASNHASNWQNYFYAINYPGAGGNPGLLLPDVEIDIEDDSVPVVALLNAIPLPNWGGTGNVGHYITIIGYNNDNGQYAYTDTCGYTTHCNSSGNNYDGGVKTVSQTTLYNAIAGLTGGGDWIW